MFWTPLNSLLPNEAVQDRIKTFRRDTRPSGSDWRLKNVEKLLPPLHFEIIKITKFPDFNIRFFTFEIVTLWHDSITASQN